jgi:hypothetical protein
MQTSKWIRVRQLRVSDFGFIRRLASKQDDFTVPPPYVLWLLQRTNPQCCLVVEHVKLGPIGYLLSILITEPGQKILYVWQLAASKRGARAGGIDRALLTLRAFIRRTGVRKVFFTVDPKSPEFRAIRRYAYSLFGSKPTVGEFVPASISRTEREYVVRVI